MVVNEIFHSLQGEGLLAGIPSVFVRLAGCPLSCTWCDTKYALSPNAGEELNVSHIIEKIKQWQCRYVVITGGEPMVNPQLPDLAGALKERNKHITIETSGINFIAGLACDLMSISPKTSNSGQKKVPDTFFAVKQLIKHYPYQLKFVVDSPDDLPEIQQAVEQIGGVSAEKVMLMPQAKTRDELIAKSPMVADLCKQTGFSFCNRLQILLWDGIRGV
jgi:7-carboxy-7-deazaguanine synthase